MITFPTLLHMDINWAFGKYLALSREIMDIEAEVKKLNDEKIVIISALIKDVDIFRLDLRAALQGKMQATGEKGIQVDPERLLVIYEELKLHEANIIEKRELLKLPEAEIFFFFKSNHPLKNFGYVEASKGRMVEFSLDGDEIKTDQFLLDAIAAIQIFK